MQYLPAQFLGEQGEGNRVFFAIEVHVLRYSQRRLSSTVITQQLGTKEKSKVRSFLYPTSEVRSLSRSF